MCHINCIQNNGGKTGMESKFETTAKDAKIFIYGKLGPVETGRILCSKIEVLQNSLEFSPMISRLKTDGGKLWLIRESRMHGLLTIQSVSYDQEGGAWQHNAHERYMLSNNCGWVLNGREGREFDKIAQKCGGIIKVTEVCAAPYVAGLLDILSTRGYLVENRINPIAGEQTTTIGYSRYTVDLTRECKENAFQNLTPRRSNITATFFPPEKKAGETLVSLPEGILMALSCPLTAWKTGQIQLMKDPVTLLKDGISYERNTLLQCSTDAVLIDGVDYYPNIKIKSIINYVSATDLPRDEYLAKLAKIENDISDPLGLSVFMQPILSPSGFTYEKSNLEKWIQTCENLQRTILDPLTNQDISGKQLVENHNLKQFINAWPDFYESRKASDSNLSF